jgi:transposase
MDGNEDDEKALQRRVQGEGCDGGDPGDLTLAELAAKHGIHHTMIGAWKRQAMDGMASLFDNGDQASKAASEAEIEKLHAKIGQLLVERDFWRKPPVDERVLEAIEDRADTPASVDRDAVPPAVDQPVVLLLHADAGKRRDAGADDGDRRDVHGMSVVRQSSDGAAFAASGSCDRPSPGPAADGEDGAGTDLPAPSHERSASSIGFIPICGAIWKSPAPTTSGART